MSPRSFEVLSRSNRHLSGGSHVTSFEDEGLMPMLRAVAERPPRSPITADYEIEATDEDSILDIDPDGDTITITVPDDDDFAIGFFVQLRQISDGTVVIEGDGAVVINAFGDPATIELGGQWAAASVEKRTTTAWLTTGQLAP